MLTYGIFLFFSVFPIIHPKGLAQISEGLMDNTELMPLGTIQDFEETEYPPFELCLSENWDSPEVARHKQWLKTIRHETPNPKIPFKVAVYIRYFNQTKYEDEAYLERNKEIFRATLAQYPLWEFVGFYIDNGSTAPNMESSVAWSELLSDCDAGKVNLIITQKVSNISKKIHEVTICARMLAASRTQFSYWANGRGVLKFYFGDKMNPTVGLTFYDFSAPANGQGHCNVVTYQGAQDTQGNSSVSVPLWEKQNLTLSEAAAYFGIGQNRLHALTQIRNCNFVLFVGNRRMIKRKAFEKYLEGKYSL